MPPKKPVTTKTPAKGAPNKAAASKKPAVSKPGAKAPAKSSSQTGDNSEIQERLDTHLLPP